MSPHTVLVVDDDPEILDFLEVALQERGYKVLVAIDGDALDAAQESQPDLILLDLMMPGMDGIEVSRRLREDPATASIPIVVMSANERLRNPSIALPVDGRLPKPFELDDLYATVAHWVQQPPR
jgi:two-component system, OmpR family, alkaline phosphatase synthesis response regulator PhoP